MPEVPRAVVGLEYEVVASWGPEDALEGLVSQVNAMLAKGWCVHGGVALGVDEAGDTVWAQAITRTEKMRVAMRA